MMLCVWDVGRLSRDEQWGEEEEEDEVTAASVQVSGGVHTPAETMTSSVLTQSFTVEFD